MLDRLLITAMIAGVFVSAYLLFRRWHFSKAVQLAANNDPLLADLPAGQASILYFTAEWCSACKFNQRPALRQLEADLPDLKIIWIDVDESPDAAKRWGVMSLPTTVVLNDTHAPTAVNHGAVSAQKLAQQLKG